MFLVVSVSGKIKCVAIGFTVSFILPRLEFQVIGSGCRLRFSRRRFIVCQSQTVVRGVVRSCRRRSRLVFRFSVRFKCKWRYNVFLPVSDRNGGIAAVNMAVMEQIQLKAQHGRPHGRREFRRLFFIERQPVTFALTPGNNTTSLNEELPAAGA